MFKQLLQAQSISIIGGADGPTSIYVSPLFTWQIIAIIICFAGLIGFVIYRLIRNIKKSNKAKIILWSSVLFILIALGVIVPVWNFIEIRNHDCSNHGMQYSIPAFYKGILYNKGALKAAEKLLSKFTYNQLKEFRYLVVKNALATKIGKYYAKDIAKELLLISENSLKAENNNEHQFLTPMLELVSQGLCPADVILKNWNGCWMKDVNKLINYLSN